MPDDRLTSELARQRRARDGSATQAERRSSTESAADEAADAAVLDLCRSFAQQMPASASVPLIESRIEPVAPHHSGGILRRGRQRPAEPQIVDREIARGWRIATAQGRSFEWVISEETSHRPRVVASGAINLFIDTDGAPWQVLLSEHGAYAGHHPLIAPELQRQARLRAIDIPILGPAPRPVSRWLRERFDLARDRGHLRTAAVNGLRQTSWIKYELRADEVAGALAEHLAGIVLDHCEPS